MGKAYSIGIVTHSHKMVFLIYRKGLGWLRNDLLIGKCCVVHDWMSAKRIFFRNKEVSFEENAGFFLTAEFFFIWWWLSGFAVRFKCYKDLLDIRLGACSLTIVKLCKPG